MTLPSAVSSFLRLMNVTFSIMIPLFFLEVTREMYFHQEHGRLVQRFLNLTSCSVHQNHMSMLQLSFKQNFL